MLTDCGTLSTIGVPLSLKLRFGTFPGTSEKILLPLNLPRGAVSTTGVAERSFLLLFFPLQLVAPEAIG